MTKSFDWYLSSAKDVIRNNGWNVFFSKVSNRLLTPVRLRFDVFITKLFTPIYRYGFHKYLYYRFFTDVLEKNKYIYWMGIPISKSPFDSWVYQEIINDLRPDILVECGTDHGGSALFFANIFDIIGHGKVITIDISTYSEKVEHPRITKMVASSVDSETIKKLKELTQGSKVMVILDSDHRRDHVLREMELYSDITSVGQYMIVEDSNLNGHPVMPGWGKGPMEAIKTWMKNRNDFMVDREREKFGVTFHPKGFLKRIR